MKFKRKNIYLNVKKSWKKIIEESMDNTKYKAIKEKIINSENQVYPNVENVFETFKYFNVKELKVVILGQDCYINCIKKNNVLIPQANGLAFSVSKEHRIPPSLNNIYKELKESNEDFIMPNHGDLLNGLYKKNIIIKFCTYC